MFRRSIVSRGEKEYKRPDSCARGEKGKCILVMSLFVFLFVCACCCTEGPTGDTVQAALAFLWKVLFYDMNKFKEAAALKRRAVKLGVDVSGCV